MMAIDRYLAPQANPEDVNSAMAHWLAHNSPLARVLPRINPPASPPCPPCTWVPCWRA